MAGQQPSLYFSYYLALPAYCWMVKLEDNNVFCLISTLPAFQKQKGFSGPLWDRASIMVGIREIHAHILNFRVLRYHITKPTKSPWMNMI